jgi:hypothetical protein
MQEGKSRLPSDALFGLVSDGIVLLVVEDVEQYAASRSGGLRHSIVLIRDRDVSKEERGRNF